MNDIKKHRFSDLLDDFEDDDTITVSVKEAKEAIIEIREEAMIKATQAQKEADAKIAEGFRPTNEEWIEIETWLEGGLNDAIDKTGEIIAKAIRES